MSKIIDIKLPDEFDIKINYPNVAIEEFVNYYKELNLSSLNCQILNCNNLFKSTRIINSKSFGWCPSNDGPIGYSIEIITHKDFKYEITTFLEDTLQTFIIKSQHNDDEILIINEILQIELKKTKQQLSECIIELNKTKQQLSKYTIELEKLIKRIEKNSI
jgi:hypothetical protein